MPNPKRARKPYRPRYAPGCMLTPTHRDKLALPAHTALLALETGYGTDESRHTLAAFMNIASVIGGRMPGVAPETRAAMDAAKHAIIAADRRFLRLGRWGLNGEEMRLLQRGVTLGDEILKRANSALYLWALDFVRRANAQSPEVLGSVAEPMGVAA